MLSRRQRQMIDVALYESGVNLSESLLPQYPAFDAIRKPADGALSGSWSRRGQHSIGPARVP